MSRRNMAFVKCDRDARSAFKMPLDVLNRWDGHHLRTKLNECVEGIVSFFVAGIPPNSVLGSLHLPRNGKSLQ